MKSMALCVLPNTKHFIYRLMDWLHAYDTTLYFLPQDPSASFSNAWLCGSAKGDDGSFQQVRTTISSRYWRVSISFELEWS